MRLAVIGGDGHATRLEFWKERFELLVRDHFHFVHDWNERLVEHALLAKLQRSDHAIDQSGGHAIGQRMIGGFFGIRSIFMRIAQNVRSARDYFHFDFFDVVGANVVLLDRLHHGGER